MDETIEFFGTKEGIIEDILNVVGNLKPKENDF